MAVENSLKTIGCTILEDYEKIQKLKSLCENGTAGNVCVQSVRSEAKQKMKKEKR